MPESPAKRPGRLLALDAFLAAPDRTLTNVHLGAIPGVQAFHQRLSDLKRMGYVLTDAVRLAEQGYYAYRLIGYTTGGDAEAELRKLREAGLLPDDIHSSLTVVPKGNVAGTVVDATTALRANRPAVAKQAKAPRRVGPGADALRARVAELEDMVDTARSEVESAQSRNAELEATIDSYESAVLNLARTIDAGDEYHETTAGDTVEVIARVASDVIDEMRAAPRPARSRQPRADRGPSGPDLMRKVLEDAGQPLHSKVLAERVMAAGGDQLYKGKTPAATMAAQLATSNKSGGDFVKVSAGCFGLRLWGEDVLAKDPIR